MSLFDKNMTREEKIKHAVNVIRMGSPLSDEERDELSALLFLDGQTWNEFYSKKASDLRFNERMEAFGKIIKKRKDEAHAVESSAIDYGLQVV